MKRFVKSKKGISPVVSTILMIMVVMVGMTILFAFLATYASGFQQGSGSSVKEQMMIEDVWFKTPTTVEIWVYNTGMVDFTIGTPSNPTIYLNDALVPAGNVQISPANIAVGEHVCIDITATSPWVSTQSYTFKIVTQRGTVLTQTFSPGT